MQKLTKKQLDEKQKILDRLTEAKQKADEAIDNLNLVREDAKEFASDILSAMEAHYDGKSEKWQEDDNGQAYSSWKDAWDEITSGLDEEVQSLDDIRSAIESFDGAPEDPGSV